MMGVEIRAPKSDMSPDPFPAYKVADAGLQNLTAEKPFPPRDNSNEAWEPGEPFGKDEIEKQYKAVHDAWVTPVWSTESEVQKKFVSTWATALGWDVTSLSSIASIPKRLKEGFMNMYVAPPLLTK